MANSAQVAVVEFKAKGAGNYSGNVSRYTYLVPPNVTVEKGDTLIVPVGNYGHTRRGKVVLVDSIVYKYAIGKVEVF